MFIQKLYIIVPDANLDFSAISAKMKYYPVLKYILFNLFPIN